MAISVLFWTLLLHVLVLGLLQILLRIQCNTEVNIDAACFPTEWSRVERLVSDLRI